MAVFGVSALLLSVVVSQTCKVGAAAAAGDGWAAVSAAAANRAAVALAQRGAPEPGDGAGGVDCWTSWVSSLLLVTGSACY